MAREGRQLGLTIAFLISGVLVYEMATGGLCQTDSVALPCSGSCWDTSTRANPAAQTFLNPISLLTPAQLFSRALRLKPTLLTEQGTYWSATQ